MPSEAFERQQKHDEILAQPRPPAEDLPPLNPPKHISNEDLEARIKFLYTDSIEKKKEKSEQQHAANEKAMTHATISGDDTAALVTRLYDESLAQQKANFDTLYANETMSYRQKPHTISKSKEKESVSHLYEEGMQRETDKHRALYQKFVLDRRTPPVRMSPAKISASADRLTSKD